MPTSPRNPTEPPQYVEWDKKMGYLYNISPFNQPMESPDPARADVGIGPYNETWGAYRSSGRVRAQKGEKHEGSG